MQHMMSLYDHVVTEGCAQKLSNEIGFMVDLHEVVAGRVLTMGTSHLVRATTMGQPAALQCARASLVCGITPSSAAATSTTCTSNTPPQLAAC